MLVEINDEVAKDEKLLKSILTIVDSAGGRHSIVLEHKKVEKTIDDTLGEGSAEKLLFRELYEKADRGIKFKKVVRFSKKKDSDASLDDTELFHVLAEKATVVLENKLSDRRFLIMALKAAGGRGIAMELDKCWTADAMGGCGQIPQLVQEYADNARMLGRVMVVHDSDKLFPQCNLPKIQVNIVNKCKEKEVSCITLKKREIENYIPDNLLLNELIRDNDFKNKWKSLTLEQKSHYDFKCGLPDKKSGFDAYEGLFDNLDTETRAVLQNGFSDNIGSEAFNERFSHYFTEEEIRTWCINSLREFKKIKESLLEIL